VTVEDNQALVRRYILECWDRGDVDLLTELCAPDYLLHLPGKTTHLPETQQLILDLHAAFPDFKLTIDDEILAGEKVIIRWTIRGTHLGPLFGLAPTGRHIEYTGIDIIRCANDKIVEFWGQPDSSGLQRQLGQGWSSTGPI